MQNLNQHDLADLLGVTKTQLEALVRDKDKWVRRRRQSINGKVRELAIPFGKLRMVHERLKYHFNKIKQPEYVYSPRKGRSQRDNALCHIGQNQILRMDIRQFYPTTSGEHVFRWAHYGAGLKCDVAGLLTHLVTIDDRAAFGSPVTPVLMTLVHRPMFDAIMTACHANEARMSLWVDDLAISGHAVPGNLIDDVREAIRSNGFRSHKIRILSGARPVTITGVPIEQGKVVAPLGSHRRVQAAYDDLKEAETDAERLEVIEQLLSFLGTYRYQVGKSSPGWRIASDRMNVLRRKKSQLHPQFVSYPDPKAARLLNGLLPDVSEPF